jgi:hypothetical protein
MREEKEKKKNIATLLLYNVGRRQVCGHIGPLHAFSVSPLKPKERGEEIREREREREREQEEEKRQK